MSALLINSYNYAKGFIWGNRFATMSYTNSTGAPVTLPQYRLIGRIFSSNKAWPQVSTATDGSQIPCGVLTEAVTVAAGATTTIYVCISGDVDSGLVVFGGSDTYATPILFNSSVPAATTTQFGTITDILQYRGILPVVTNEITYADNS